MSKTDMDVYKKNLRLKKEFALRNLPLKEITELTPYNLELENRRLQNLLFWVDRYEEFGSQEALESMGMIFPPVLPGVSPESDWYKFKAWLAGKELSSTLESRLDKGYKPKPANEISQEDFPEELRKLKIALKKCGFKSAYNSDMAAGVEYSMIIDYIEEKHDILGEGVESMGGWTFDGCSGYCPGCVQRPWCDAGQDMCWTEDEKAGKIYFVPELENYVSASPQSLELLQESQKEKDAEMANFNAKMEKERNQDSGYVRSPFDISSTDEEGRDLPFNMN